MLSRFAFLTFVPLMAAAVVVPGGVAAAIPLDLETCVRLREERLHLALAGVRENLAKGPVWGAANLPAAQLRDIERLIELDEQITFRCPDVVAAADGAAVVPLPKRKPKVQAAVPPPRRKPGVSR